MNAHAFVASDPALPALDAALDPSRAAAAFERVLEEAGHKVSELKCSVDRVRLKRGLKAVIGYRLEGRGGNDEAFTQLAMARVYPHALLDQRYAEASSQPLSAPVIGPPIARLDSLNAIAWFFPNDRKLAMGSNPFGHDAIRDMLRHAFDDAEIVGEDARVIRYVPEQGCTAFVAVDARRGNGDFVVEAYAKCRSDSRGRTSHLLAEAFAKHYGVEALAPRALYYDASRRVGWQSRLRGNPLRLADVLEDPDRWAARICASLDRLQAVSIDGLQQNRVMDLAEQARLRALETIPALPVHGRTLAGLARRLREAAPPEGRMVLLHGDLHPANILAERDKVRFIDLDAAAFGDPLADRASLTAALLKHGCESGLADDALEILISAFRREAGRRFDWLLAASLMSERIYRCGTRLNGRSADTVQRLVSLARNALERVESR